MSILAMLVLLSSVLLALPVRAESDIGNDNRPVATQYKARHFYVGAGLGFTELEPDTEELFATDVDDTNSEGFQFLAGISVNQWLSLEFNLSDLGAAGFANGATIEYQQYGASALFYAPRRAVLFGQRSLVAFGRIGYGVLENSSSGDIDFEQVNSNHLFYGLGAEYLTSGNWGARLEAYQFDEDIQYVQLALIYRFRQPLIPYVPPVQSRLNSVSVPVAKIIEPVEPVEKAKPREHRQPTFAAALPLPPALKNDSDGDGVVNSLDKCLYSAKTTRVNREGCRFFKDKLSGVKFLSGSAELTGMSKRILKGVISEIKDYPKFRFVIAAHTDNVEDKSANSQLSRQRAEMVVQYLVSRGVNEANLVVIAHGDAIPIASNQAARGRAENRRVDIEVIDVYR